MAKKPVKTPPCYHPNVLAAVRKGLEKHKGIWPQIARLSDVSYSYLAHVASGYTPDPGIVRVQRVWDTLHKIETGKIKIYPV